MTSRAPRQTRERAAEERARAAEHRARTHELRARANGSERVLADRLRTEEFLAEIAELRAATFDRQATAHGEAAHIRSARARAGHAARDERVLYEEWERMHNARSRAEEARLGPARQAGDALRYRRRGTRKMRRQADDSRAGLIEDHGMSSTEIRAHLCELAQERAEAERVGLIANETYMAALDGEIVTYRLALVGVMVTEIAILRGELFGRQFG